MVLLDEQEHTNGYSGSKEVGGRLFQIEYFIINDPLTIVPSYEIIIKTVRNDHTCRARELLGNNIFGTWRGCDNHECQNEGDRKYHAISTKKKTSEVQFEVY